VALLPHVAAELGVHELLQPVVQLWVVGWAGGGWVERVGRGREGVERVGGQGWYGWCGVGWGEGGGYMLQTCAFRLRSTAYKGD
jgi:hypothetical protein